MKKQKLKFKPKELINADKANEFKKFKARFKKGRLGEKILTLFMLFIVLVFIAVLAFLIYIIISSPEFDAEKLYTKEASIIYDAKGNEIARLGTENRERVTYDDLPEVFIDALIATEDSRFFQHSGVDMARFLKATLGQLAGSSGAGGASTLTMQIAKQRINGNEATGIKGIIRKFSDIYVAVFKLEKNYTKEQIIELYVNIPQLGSVYGIEQASQKYFGKSISEVSLSEAALLAGLFQAPSAYNPYNSAEKAESRRNQVLNLMQRHGYITEEECELAKSIKVADLIVKNGTATNKYQGFINTVIEEVKKRTGKDPYTVPMKIESTMIPEKQDVINDIYNGKTSFKWADDAIQAGIAVTDVKTGALIAVGASRKQGELVYNYATMINRHPGSSAKPIFDYGPAIEYLNWSTGTTIVDDAYTYSNGAYIKNWDNSYKGIMTVKTALASSRNIPALQAFQAVNQADINKFVTGLGITPEYEKGSTFINESHSIGGFNGVNPLQMSAAYGAFARGGVYIEPYSFTKVEFLDTGEIYTVTPEKRTVMSEATAYMINMILKYAVTSGNVTAGSKSGTDIASKTGTSTVSAAAKKAAGITGSIIGNSWQLSYSPQYVCAVWVGYDNEVTKEHYLTSSKGSYARKTLSKELTKGIQESGHTWTKPSSVVSATIELETIPLALASDYTPSKLKSTEYFKAGTVPDEVSTRFSKLENPTGLKATYNIGSVSLTWNAIKTPDAIDVNYLTNYFKEGYKTFADKYLKKRLEYNENNIGNIGYEVYVSNSSGGYTNLGFTTNTSFTYNATLSESKTFMVKSSYSKFKDNMSSGITVSVTPTGEITPSATANWKVELNGAGSMTVQEYYDFINEGNSPVKVMDSGYDVTKQAKISNPTCWDSTNNEVSCLTLDCNENYYIQYTITYNNKSKSLSRTLTSGC